MVVDYSPCCLKLVVPYMVSVCSTFVWFQLCGHNLHLKLLHTVRPFCLNLALVLRHFTRKRLPAVFGPEEA